MSQSTGLSRFSIVRQIQNSNQILQLLGTLILLLLLSLILVMREAVKFNDFEPDDVFELLTVIAGVATLQQTVVGTFISSWRGPQRKIIDKELVQFDLQLKSEGLSPEQRQNLSKQRKEKELELTKYKADTRKISLWVNLLAGFAVSVVGLHALEALANPAEIEKLSHYQALGFRVMDVLLTGSLLSGGAEGVGQVTAVFGNFINSSAEK